MQRRVAITGVGIVSTFGNVVDAFWDAVLAGQTGGSDVALEGLPVLPGVRVAEFDVDAVIGKREARRMDRVGIFAAVAAAHALADAGQHGVAPERIGTAIGCAHGGAGTVEETQRTLLERGLDRVSPFAIPLGLVNSPVAGTARLHALKGPSAAPATACAAGSDAIGWAYERIRDGRAEAMVAGGAEAAIVPSVLAGYIRLGAIASLTHGAAAASRPFDTARDGFVMAEGAGVLVLEEWEHAVARDAHIYGEVVGYGQSCDAGHLTSPDETGEGPARAVQAALDDAGLTAAAIGYVNAHATSTPVGDTAEAHALQRAGLGQTPVSSTKGQHGHTIGAAGAIEAIATLACFARNQLPPCANLVQPDVELDLVREARPATPDYVMSTGFGFGGHDAALIFRRA
ncbi:MAG: beta-ketoacyl-[acyl-carrier-protein] synthase family protein [Thermoleophilia bacterium]|nr:beta-ketoacyl-[acyl-carrier-protein] synthase family protein [Thermoleophilia bacterium]